jgi:metal-responsive CopG/Arc/MetJ family transcriptional regulator
LKINLASICKTWDEHPMDKMIAVGIPLPADAVKQIDQLAQSQYLSRAAAVRVIILQELARRAQAVAAATAEEVAA